MKKYILISLISLLSHNAYAFNFENYTPTKETYEWYPEAAAYSLSFSRLISNSTSDTITTYDIDYDTFSIVPKYYIYSYEVLPQAEHLNIPIEINTYELIGSSKVISNMTDIVGKTYNDTFVRTYAGAQTIYGDFINNSGDCGVRIGSYGTNMVSNFIGNNFSSWAIRNFSPRSNTLNDSETSLRINFIANTFGQGAIDASARTYIINGSFIDNSAINGSLIYNAVNPIWLEDGNKGIEYISGTFINNSTGNGVIYNPFINDSYSRTIGNINGTFVANSATSNDSQSTDFGRGGAIHNQGEISQISGTFIGNSAVYPSESNIFYYTYAGRGGAIYTTQSITDGIDADFIGNYATDFGGAIFSEADIKLTSTTYGGRTISDNYVLPHGERKDIAITSMASIEFSNYYNITVNDEIEYISGTSGLPHLLTISGMGTGYVTFNNDIHDADAVLINNGKKMVFGRTPDNYTGTQDIGHFTNNPTMNLNNATFDIANGYTETVTLNGLSALDDNNFIHIDLDTSNKTADIISVQTSITGQINLVVNALSDLDINDNIIWFANANDATEDSFILDSVDNLSYDLNIVFDSTNKQWGLQKVNTEPENPDDPNPNNPDTPDNPDVPGNPDTPDNPDNPDTPDNPNPGNPDNPDTPDDPNPGNPDTPVTPNTPDTPEQPVVQNDPEPVLPKAVVQMADYTTNTIKHTVQKLTNSMQKRVGELQWVASNAASDSQNAFWTRGIHKNFDAADTAVGLSGIEFGYDRIVSSSENYKFFIGGLGYIASGDSKFDTNTLDINGYGLGAYAMLLNKSGLFMDLVFRQHFIGIDAQSTETDYTATSLNMEIGKEFVFGTDEGKMKWFAKPSLEGTFIYTPKTKIGEFNIDSSTVKNASLTLLAGPRWVFQSGTKFQAYSKVAYNLDASDNVSVIINNVNTKRSVFADTFEMGIGLDYRDTDNTTSIYMEASYITGTDYSEISGNLGLRYAF